MHVYIHTDINIYIYMYIRMHFLLIQVIQAYDRGLQ